MKKGTLPFPRHPTALDPFLFPHPTPMWFQASLEQSIVDQARDMAKFEQDLEREGRLRKDAVAALEQEGSSADEQYRRALVQEEKLRANVASRRASEFCLPPKHWLKSGLTPPSFNLPTQTSIPKLFRPFILRICFPSPK